MSYSSTILLSFSAEQSLPSPTLVANLWDVTDRDMDRYTKSVFSKVKLDKGRVAQWKASDAQHRPDPSESMSIVRAVALSREECKMDYLVGAAPVVYGIPFYL